MESQDKRRYYRQVFMKQIFRFLSAELNGFFISACNHFLNLFCLPLVNDLTYLSGVQFKLEDEVGPGELPMLEDDIRGIGRTAGLSNPYVSAESNLGSIIFTTSHKKDGHEYSERGLLRIKTEVFEFFRTTQSSYPDDIVSLASEALRASFVPEGQPVLGYIAESSVVLDTDGTWVEANILPSPPVGEAYYPFYGKEFLFMAESFLVEAFIDIEIYKKLIELYQSIRYNGPSIESFIGVTSVLMEDYIVDIEFIKEPDSTKVVYSLNLASLLEQRIKKGFVWEFLVASKFKQFVLEER